MKKIIFPGIAVLAGTILLLYSGCMKDEANLTGERSIKSANQCDCINPCDPVYFEATFQKIVTWGNLKHQFSKTVDVICYNTLTDFVVEVTSSDQWADMLIDDVSVWGQGPVAANVMAVYTVDLPTGWNGGDDYDFTLKVVGSGPPAVFDIEYALAGPCLVVSDVDGNCYQTVEIGTQTWMAENLKTTKLNDNTVIPPVSDNSAWGALNTPGYCWYNNDLTTYGSVYGAIYNWYAVETGKLCPTGWHVPTDLEWQTLEMFLGMSQSTANLTSWRGTDEGGKMKETGTTHWLSPNTGATNSSGFTALPGGYRHPTLGNLGIADYGGWWSSTAYASANAWTRLLSHDFSSVKRSPYPKNCGYSVRCVMD